MTEILSADGTQKECLCTRGVVGGTFSLLHRGHRRLLRFALLCSQELLVGVTSDEYVKERGKSHPVEPYEVRALSVLTFLKTVDPSRPVAIVPIDDEYGPATSDPCADCIFVSEETFPGAVKVNMLRRLRGLPPLKIFAVELVTVEGVRLSSTYLWERLQRKRGSARTE
ncbi:phosphopantetheine adenylyltransferase [Thermofilum pendens]|uniref:Phosphopantetheine adenylyltransferase n=1 Tax=Thermofilum pendens (strain DSM 2475 / Hrk 5) TaxID=368408 RepID=A1RX89_THEPD|nr:phosphopantetheine adenylyltransferase [Thermofilum pendens]ABL77819.1 cytidyltransferase-related domain [Thermofilum pendens Hrk 5]